MNKPQNWSFVVLDVEKKHKLFTVIVLSDPDLSLKMRFLGVQSSVTVILGLTLVSG